MHRIGLKKLLLIAWACALAFGFTYQTAEATARHGTCSRACSTGCKGNGGCGAYTSDGCVCEYMCGDGSTGSAICV